MTGKKNFAKVQSVVLICHFLSVRFLTLLRQDHLGLEVRVSRLGRFARYSESPEYLLNFLQISS